MKRLAFLCHPYHRGGVTRWMADAAMAATATHEVYFVTVEPTVPFFSAGGRETLLQLITNSDRIHRVSQPVGREFEFGEPQYREYIYSKLLSKVPPGTPVILSDDHAVWEAATHHYETYPIVGVLHADEHHYYDLAVKHQQRVDLLACVSERIRTRTLELLPSFESTRVPVIPCGIHLPTPHFNTHRMPEIRLVYVGRISNYQKRTTDLVKISSRLAELGISFHLNIIGDGKEPRQELEEKVKEAGLQQHISFLGWLSQQQVAAQLSGSDVLILTSDFEGMPIAMMEGLAMGCGFVGTRVSGIEDIESHRHAADCLGIFEVGNIEEAVQHIQRVAAIPAQRRMLAARALAEAEFTMDVCLTRYYAAINALLIKPVAKTHIKSIPLSLHIKSRLLAVARTLRMKMR